MLSKFKDFKAEQDFELVKVVPSKLREELYDAAGVLTYLGEPIRIIEEKGLSEAKALLEISLRILTKAKLCFTSSPPVLLQTLLMADKTSDIDELKRRYQTAKAITLFLLRTGDSSLTSSDLYSLSFNKTLIDAPKGQQVKTSNSPSPAREIDRYLILQISKDLVRPIHLKSFLLGARRSSGFSVAPVAPDKAFRKTKADYIELFLRIDAGIESEHVIKTMVRREVMRGYSDLTASYHEGDIGGFEVRYSEWIQTGKVFYRVDAPEQQLVKIPPLIAHIKKT